MSQKSIDKFLDFLEEHKVYSLIPAAFTMSEIIAYAETKGFHFSREALKNKYESINKSAESDLSREIEQCWKRSLSSI